MSDHGLNRRNLSSPTTPLNSLKQSNEQMFIMREAIQISQNSKSLLHVLLFGHGVLKGCGG